MTEDRGPYNPYNEDPEDTVDEPERIGDILHRLIDERGWPLPRGITPTNGTRPGADDDPWRGDA